MEDMSYVQLHDLANVLRVRCFGYSDLPGYFFVLSTAEYLECRLRQIMDISEYLVCHLPYIPSTITQSTWSIDCRNVMSILEYLEHSLDEYVIYACCRSRSPAYTTRKRFKPIK